MNLRALVLGVVVAFPAWAQTGICDSNPPTTTEACINAIQASGGVVNDIFRDSNGRAGVELPSFARLINIYPSCGTMNCAGCDPGTSSPPYDCPGQYSCTTGACTFASVGAAVNALDHVWGHPCRLTTHGLVNGCPQYGACVGDGNPDGYFPWEGLIFDLGGPSNQVAIFAENDHGPQPCESAEYTIFLTNNPMSQNIILQPTTTGADPNSWNRAVLRKIFTKGFVEIRPPDPAGHAACGDTPLYSVEEDSMVTVYGLPCGINFRYAAVVAGNDGRDFPECTFHSSEAELDAVAGLTEQGAGVCPDVDRDGYTDCACPGAPALCDCVDTNASVHPNAPEACDAPSDLNCNGVHPEPCPVNTGCHAGVCVPTCEGELVSCPAGSGCQTTDAGLLCVPTTCAAGGCPPGSVCDTASGTCRAACDGSVKCPNGQRCVDGECVDPCRSITCQAGFTCADGVCHPPCSCFVGDVGCSNGQRCNGPTGCVAPACVGVHCGPGTYCGPTGTCVGFCDGVVCPANRVCLPTSSDGGPGGCVNLCAGVQCSAGASCDFATGTCQSSGTDAGPPGHDGGDVVIDAGSGRDGGSSGVSGTGKGCGCSETDGGLVFLAAVAAMVVAGLRRR